MQGKWDVTLNWNPTLRPLNEQKPSKIVKQKAEQQKNCNSAICREQDRWEYLTPSKRLEICVEPINNMII